MPGRRGSGVKRSEGPLDLTEFISGRSVRSKGLPGACGPWRKQRPVGTEDRVGRGIQVRAQGRPRRQGELTDSRGERPGRRGSGVKRSEGPLDLTEFISGRSVRSKGPPGACGPWGKQRPVGAEDRVGRGVQVRAQGRPRRQGELTGAPEKAGPFQAERFHCALRLAACGRRKGGAAVSFAEMSLAPGPAAPGAHRRPGTDWRIGRHT